MGADLGGAGDLLDLKSLFLQLSVTRNTVKLGSEQSPNWVLLEVGDAATGMLLENGNLRWQIMPADAEHFADLIAGLLSAPHEGGHNYLDCATGAGIEVRVSLGEYPEDFNP